MSTEEITNLAANAIQRGYLQALEHCLIVVRRYDKETAVDFIGKLIENKKKELEP
jgi:hypothetical protein